MLLVNVPVPAAQLHRTTASQVFRTAHVVSTAEDNRQRCHDNKISHGLDDFIDNCDLSSFQGNPHELNRSTKLREIKDVIVMFAVNNRDPRILASGRDFLSWSYSEKRISYIFVNFS